jgi:acyl carrier protein
MTLISVISERHAINAVNEVLEAREGMWGEIDLGTSLLDLGFDSLELSELFMVLEELAGERLDPASAGDVVLVADLCTLRSLFSTDV